MSTLLSVYELRGSAVSAKYSGYIGVAVGGVEGRVCSQGWTDTEAQVFCSTMGYRYVGKVIIGA